MNDRWSDRLSDYLDGELDAAERAELERHLAGCDECSATLEQLHRVVARARALEDVPPRADLWPGIAARIGVAGDGAPVGDVGVTDIEAARRRRRGRLAARRLTFSLPQLAAASVALMMLSGGTAWLLSRATNPPGESPAPAGATSFVPASPTASLARSYDVAVVELERILEESRDRLDTVTVRIIEENLLVIDNAIAQAQRALARDPESIYLSEHLAATMQQKLEFLRQAAEMTSAAS
jgi:anti-sigma factor RsiW